MVMMKSSLVMLEVLGPDSPSRF